jgi:uncharacterized protein involved in outer membrane biogenesis
MFLVCAFAMAAFGWMLLLPGLFTSVIENRTGFPASVESFYANPFTGEVRMRGLVVVNPAGFNETKFIDLQQFSAKADLFSLLGKSPVLDMTTLDLARITVVTNAQGANNLDLVYRRLALAGEKKAVAAGKPSPLQFLVRNLDVRVNEVVVKDERAGKISENVHQLAFQRSYSNVTPATDFSENLPTSVAAAGKDVGSVLTGDLKQIVTRATQPIDRKTYAWGDKKGTPPSPGITR